MPYVRLMSASGQASSADQHGARPEPTPKPGPAPWADRSRAARYVLAGVVLIGAVILAAVEPGLREVCDQQVTDAGEVVRACTQAGPTSLQVLLVLAVLLLLFLPDLVEVGFAGVTIKRALGQVQEEVTQTAEEVGALSARIEQAMTATQTSTQNVFLTPDAQGLLAYADQVGANPAPVPQGGLPALPVAEPGQASPADLSAAVDEGRFALAQAALDGLLRDLPEPWPTGRLVALLAVPGALQPLVRTGPVELVPDEVVDLLAAAGPVQQVWLAVTGPDQSPGAISVDMRATPAVSVAAASMHNASGRPLGVLAVAVGRASTPGRGGSAGLRDEAAAALERAAEAVSRLIVDVLRFDTDSA